MKYSIIWLLVFLLFATFSLAEVSHYYRIEMQYDGGIISYSSVKVEPFAKPIEELGADYYAEVIGANGSLLSTTFISFPNFILYDEVDKKGELAGGGMIILNKSKTTVYLPYSKTAKEINIYDEDINKILTINVGELSKGIPQKITSIKQQRAEQKEIKKANQKISETNPLKWLLVGIGLLGLIVIMSFVLYKKRK